ncbi:hypothetical protein ACIF6H_34010 [Streptomyces microflavus]|uniref:hypothetical protein n=1 Tax=Streptomyces microflavus TaxID=1919 RepID=UPI0033BC3E73
MTSVGLYFGQLTDQARSMAGTAPTVTVAMAGAESRRTPRRTLRTYGLSRAWCWAATVSSAARERA